VVAVNGKREGREVTAANGEQEGREVTAATGKREGREVTDAGFEDGLEEPTLGLIVG